MALQLRALALEPCSGIMDEEIQTLCIKCIQCKNIVSQMTQYLHQCSDAAKALDVKELADAIFQSPQYCLDAIGDGVDGLAGLTKDEFKDLFYSCMSCDRSVMTCRG